MGILRDAESGELTVLEPQTSVGRDPRCSLRLTSDWVSTQHALLRWFAGGWELRDLSSRNGTYLDGVRIKPGLSYTLREGSRLAFGRRPGREWVLADDSGPVPMAGPLAGGVPALVEGNLIAIPSADCPVVTILNDGEHWILEDAEGGRSRLSSGDVFDVNGVAWRFSVPSDLPSPTRLASAMMDLEVRHVHLAFRVSSDEEVVTVEVHAGEIQRDAGIRSFNYLLLTLARRRMKDMRDGYPDGECGWIEYDEVEHDASMAPPQLNLDVFRIRKHFAKLGVADAERLVERRPRTRQLRIGTSSLSISTF
jgi:hypothetical protein